TLKKTSDNSAISGKTISFTLNGNLVGTADTNGSGVATLSGVSLSGINAGVYLAGTNSGVAASFAGDSSFATSSASNTLTVGKADQTIIITQNAPASAAYNTAFDVKATGGGSRNAVTFAAVTGSVCTVGSVANASSMITAPVTISSGTGTCQLALNQTGDANYSAATQVLSATTNASKASQTIAWSNPVGITYGTALSTTQLNATLTTGDGALTY